jgi:phosphoribosylformylglycinamidine synthase
MKGSKVPSVDMQEAFERYRKLSQAIKKGVVESCHDCSDGGLGVALAETAFSGNLGMRINMDKVPYEGAGRSDFMLFSESQSRFVVTVSPKNVDVFESCMAGSTFAHVGEVNESDTIEFFQGDKVLFSRKITELKKAWQTPLAW